MMLCAGLNIGGSTRLLQLAGIVLLTGLLVSCAPGGIYHTVESGQTLYRISRTYGIPEAELARINRIADPTKLRVGQKIYLPGVTQPRKVPATAYPKLTDKAKTAAPPVARQAAPSPPPQKPAAVAARPQEKSAPAQSADAKRGTFAWPIKGKVVSRFGAREGGASKGIEIACSEGSPVSASAPGKVIYSGRGIRGYGHLVIIEHAQDFFTVYGYNKKNLVKTNDYVGQGDKIALCGDQRLARSSRLHFEIRRGKSAVDPIFYLP